jgi:hypothetical protein
MRRKIEVGDLHGAGGRMLARLRAENLPRAKALDARKQELTELAAARRQAAAEAVELEAALTAGVGDQAVTRAHKAAGQGRRGETPGHTPKRRG